MFKVNFEHVIAGWVVARHTKTDSFEYSSYIVLSILPFQWPVIEVDVTTVRIFLREKTISSACFEASGLNNIFHLYAHCDILDKISL